MKYYRIDKITNEKKEITYEKALNLCLGCYKDNDMTRDMLEVVNRIDCRYSYVVIEDNGMVLMAGLYNMLPMGVDYDDSGNRLN